MNSLRARGGGCVCGNVPPHVCALPEHIVGDAAAPTRSITGSWNGDHLEYSDGNPSRVQQLQQRRWRQGASRGRNVQNRLGAVSKSPVLLSPLNHFFVFYFICLPKNGPMSQTAQDLEWAGSDL